MANLPVTVRVCTPLPVSVRDLPKLENLANAIAATAGAPTNTITMTQIGDDLVLSFEVKAR